MPAKFKVNTKEYIDNLAKVRKEFNDAPNAISFDEAFNNRSRIKVNFKCPKCNGVYDLLLNNRLISGQNCPYCAGKRLLKGSNDLLSKFPNLVSEWDYTKNSIKPDEILAGSDKIIHWVCSNGHTWSTPLSERTTSGNGCPLCSNNQTSFPEQLILKVISKYYEAKSRYKINSIEYDIVIPDIRVCIEYNGGYWHEGKGYEHKLRNAINNGYRFIAINEAKEYNQHYRCLIAEMTDRYALIDTEQIKKNRNKSAILIQTLSKVFVEWLDKTIELSDDEYSSSISSASTKVLEHSLYEDYPDLMEEFSPKNKVNPKLISKASDIVVIWECKHCKHEWQTYVVNRTGNNNSGCPECAKKVRAISRRYNLINSYNASNKEKQRMFNAFLKEKGYDRYIIDLWLKRMGY